VRSGTIKKRESIVPETIKKRLEIYPGWSDLVRLRKKTQPFIGGMAILPRLGMGTDGQWGGGTFQFAATIR